MVRLATAFLVSFIATTVAVAAVARGVSFGVVAPIVGLAVVAAAVARRSKPVEVPATPPPPSKHLAATIVARACPKCGDRVEWVATFRTCWCSRCGRVRDR